MAKECNFLNGKEKKENVYVYVAGPYVWFSLSTHLLIIFKSAPRTIHTHVAQTDPQSDNHLINIYLLSDLGHMTPLWACFFICEMGLWVYLP